MRGWLLGRKGRTADKAPGPAGAAPPRAVPQVLPGDYLLRATLKGPLRPPSRIRSQMSGDWGWSGAEANGRLEFWRVGGGGLMPLMTTNESLEMGEGVFNTWNEKFEFAHN